MKAYGGSGCIEPYFLDLGTSWEVSGQLHAPNVKTEVMEMCCVVRDTAQLREAVTDGYGAIVD
jgi:hypothetical protein